MTDYIEINRNSWNNKVATHVASDFYDVEGFLKGKTSLNKFELDLLGNIEGKSILHFQCHFGQDIPGWLVASEGGLTVALDITISES